MWSPVRLCILNMIPLHWKLTSCKFSMALSLYSRGDDWFPPPIPPENHVWPTHLPPLENHLTPPPQAVNEGWYFILRLLARATRIVLLSSLLSFAKAFYLYPSQIPQPVLRSTWLHKSMEAAVWISPRVTELRMAAKKSLMRAQLLAGSRLRMRASTPFSKSVFTPLSSSTSCESCKWRLQDDGSKTFWWSLATIQ